MVLAKWYPGLEKKLTVLAVDSKKEFTISPLEGYGEINRQLKLKTDISVFSQDLNAKVGMAFSADIGDAKTQHFKVTHIERSKHFYR